MTDREQIELDRLRLLMAAGRASTDQIIRCARLEIQRREEEGEEARVWVGRPAVKEEEGRAA